MAVSVRNRLDRKKRSGNGTAGFVLESELNARLQAFETSFKLHPTLTTRHILGNEYLTVSGDVLCFLCVSMHTS